MKVSNELRQALKSLQKSRYYANPTSRTQELISLAVKKHIAKHPELKGYAKKLNKFRTEARKNDILLEAHGLTVNDEGVFRIYNKEKFKNAGGEYPDAIHFDADFTISRLLMMEDDEGAKFLKSLGIKWKEASNEH